MRGTVSGRFASMAWGMLSSDRRVWNIVTRPHHAEILWIILEGRHARELSPRPERQHSRSAPEGDRHLRAADRLSNILLWALMFAAAVQLSRAAAAGRHAYGFGLRHAVDADHISAIDNVTRKLMQESKRPVGGRLLLLAGPLDGRLLCSPARRARLGFITSGLSSDNSRLKQIGGLIGTSVSAFFLFAIAIINIVILVRDRATFRKVTRGGVYDEEEIDDYLNQRGFFARIFRGLFKSIDASWKMYPRRLPLRPGLRHGDRGGAAGARRHVRGAARAVLCDRAAAAALHRRHVAWPTRPTA